MQNETLTAPKFSWSTVTCGEACWRGKDDNCVCSCGGKNHGIWRNSTDAQVLRTCKIHGHLYKLVGMGNAHDTNHLQIELLEKYGLFRCYDYYGDGNRKHQSYVDQFKCRGDKDIWGFPLVSKQATLSQCKRWKELDAFSFIENKFERYSKAPYLLWEIVDAPEPVQCLCINKQN
jgi:hypothetical protein